MNPLAAEDQAWLARERPGIRTTWEIDRRACAFWAVASPVLMMIASAVSVWLLLTRDVSESAPGDPGRAAATTTASILGICAVFGVLGLVAAREFGLLAIYGGGLSTTPDGVRFRFGRRSMLLPWSDIESVGASQRTNTKGGAYTVLAIEFIDGGYRWPRAVSLWSSNPYRLCISPYILTDPAEAVADGLAAALDQQSDIASRESRTPSERRPGRHLGGRIIAIALCLLFVAMISLYTIPQELQPNDTGGLVIYVLAGLVAIGLAIGFWRGGGTFYERVKGFFGFFFDR